MQDTDGNHNQPVSTCFVWGVSHQVTVTDNWVDIWISPVLYLSLAVPLMAPVTWHIWLLHMEITVEERTRRMWVHGRGWKGTWGWGWGRGVERRGEERGDRFRWKPNNCRLYFMDYKASKTCRVTLTSQAQDAVAITPFTNPEYNHCSPQSFPKVAFNLQIL